MRSIGWSEDIDLLNHVATGSLRDLIEDVGERVADLAEAQQLVAHNSIVLQENIGELQAVQRAALDSMTEEEPQQPVARSKPPVPRRRRR